MGAQLGFLIRKRLLKKPTSVFRLFFEKRRFMKSQLSVSWGCAVRVNFLRTQFFLYGFVALLGEIHGNPGFYL
ncbi:hypothetical protein MRB53_030017 [Persea americana]|uniref:Uncharacterized protein n=1 Tax=Persea americana TaxID=3435 RepID=A0ACC2KK48_PERAE|nr:hypothetical protein MRB53_030017 [Persea americana]